MTPRAVIYLRQSKDHEGTGLAVERQLEDCQRLATGRGWEVTRVITDNDVSASSIKVRPGYRELLAEIDAKGCDVVVAWAPDRLLRRPIEMEDLIDRTERTGVKIVTCQNDMDLESPAGRLAARMFAVVARSEVENKSLRQKRQARQAAEKGLPPARRCFGYEQGGMVVNEAEAAVVREAYARVLRGESLVSIVRAMDAAGLPTTRGYPWDRTTVRNLILNPRYIAVRYHRGEEVGPGTWPAIIPEDDWRKAVALLTDPARKSNHGGTARKWIGGSLFLCGRCGTDVRVGYRRNNVRIYVCRASDHLARVAQPVDELVAAVMEARLALPDVAALLDEGDEEMAALRADAAAINAKIARAVRDYDDELIDAETLRTVKGRRTAELEAVQRRMAAAARTSTLSTLAASGDRVAAWRALDLSARRTVIDALMTVTLLPGRFGRFDPNTVRIDWKTE